MLTGFQIRAARGCLSLHLKDVSSRIGIHYTTLTRLESQTANLTYINSNTRTSLLLKNFYQSHGIIFPRYNSIELSFHQPKLDSDITFSRFQLKISRIALRFSRKSLGSDLNIPETSIAGWETGGHMLSAFSPHDSSIISNIKCYFKNLGLAYPSFNIVEIHDEPVVRNR